MNEVLRYALTALILLVVIGLGVAAILHVLLDPIRRCRHLGPVEVDTTGERVTLRCHICRRLIAG